VRKPDVVSHLVGVAVIEVDVAMRLHASMPDAVLAIDMLAIEVNEVLSRSWQTLVDMQLALLCIHDAKAIGILGEHILQELIGERSGGGLFNE
jgi:hypothetical protein